MLRHVLILIVHIYSLFVMQTEASLFITAKLPLDEQGFTQSFNLNDFDPAAVKAFYDKYGLVVFDNILNQEEIKMTISDLWKDMEEATKGRISRKDPKTWDYAEKFGGFGFVNSKPIVQEQICKNRSHPKVYKSFKTLFELTSGQTVNEPLLALFDRGSILRPSKHNPEWQSTPLYHFDIHPWWWTNVVQNTESDWREYNLYNSGFPEWLGEGNYIPKVRNFTKIQGVLALSDTNPQSGGFECVCGFQNYIDEWCKKIKQFTPIQKCPELLQNMQKVYQRAGSIILFTRQLPHNIFPNLSDKVRYAQYLRMAPESTLMLTEEEKTNRRRQVKKLMHKNEDRRDPIVREVYMLEGEPEEAQGYFQALKQKVSSLFW